MTIDALLTQLRADGEHETFGAATDGDIEVTEAALGRPLPESFRHFQTEFSNGAYLFMLQEVSATGAGNRQVGAIQNVRSYAISLPSDALVDQEDAGAVPAGALVPYSLDSNGNCWCFVAEKSAPQNEYPVAYFVADQRRLVASLPGFEQWLKTLIEERDEVIRTLRDWDELDLG